MPARRRDPLAREEPAELQIAATNGSIVTDSRGRKYIDFVMGWCVGILADLMQFAGITCHPTRSIMVARWGD